MVCTITKSLWRALETGKGEGGRGKKKSLVPTVLRGNVPSAMLYAGASDAERRKRWVPTQSVGTRKIAKPLKM